MKIRNLTKCLLKTMSIILYNLRDLITIYNIIFNCKEIQSRRKNRSIQKECFTSEK